MKYIPQAPPFEMIGRLLHANPMESSSETDIEDSNLFVEGGFFTEPGLIENIAQTAAAGIGYLAWAEGASKSPIGFIGQIKNLKILRLPQVGQQIITHVSVQNTLLNVRVLKAAVYLSEEVIATAELKVFLQDQKDHK